MMDYLRYYESFGCSFSPVGQSNAKSDCKLPDCPNQEGHFFVNTKNGQCNCKKCGFSGNVFSFATEYHKQWLKLTNQESYDDISTHRGLPAEVFKIARWAYNSEDSKWLVPHYNKDNSNVYNLGTFDPTNPNKKQRFRIFGRPEITTTLYRVFERPPKNKSRIITEGQHDSLAVYAAYRSAKVTPGYDIQGCPGSAWRAEWNAEFKGCDVIFFPDNDEGGEKFKESIIKHASGFRYTFANWDIVQDHIKGFSGKDPRDIYIKCKRKSDCLDIINDMITEAEEPTQDVEQAEVATGYTIDVEAIEPIPSRKTFRSQIQKSMYTNQSILRSIDLVLAATLAVHIPGEPIWLFVVGPPSSGKSHLIEGFGGKNKYFDYCSKITPTSLVSGLQSKDGKENSGVMGMHRKAVFIKDYTILLNMPDSLRQQVDDILRDAYDGYLKFTFGNGKVVEATGLKFGIVAGVTNAIHTRNDSDMGERFFKIDYLGTDSSDFSEDEHMDSAWGSIQHKKENKKLLSETLIGYYKHLLSTLDPEAVLQIEVPEEIRNKLKNLAKLVVRVNTKVVKDRYEGMKYKPSTALATRAYLTFGYLARLLTHIKQEEEVSYDTFLDIRKLAYDSCAQLSLQTLEYLYNKKEATKNQMVEDLRIPSTRMHQILNDYIQLNILHRVKSKNGKDSGRDTFTYTLDEVIKDCFEVASPKKKKKNVTTNSSSKASITRTKKRTRSV